LCTKIIISNDEIYPQWEITIAAPKEKKTKSVPCIIHDDSDSSDDEYCE